MTMAEPVEHLRSYSPAMNRIIADIDAEIRQLRATRAVLAGGTNARKVGEPTRKQSAATRAKMADAQRARWATVKVRQ
jgi:hypothetical protein